MKTRSAERVALDEAAIGKRFTTEVSWVFTTFWAVSPKYVETREVQTLMVKRDFGFFGMTFKFPQIHLCYQDQTCL